MARLMSLEDDADSEDVPPNLQVHDAILTTVDAPRPNPNLNLFTAALSCYPVVSDLTKYLDLNTLSELARTCRQAREDLLQHRSILISQTLRCSNQNVTPGKRLADALNASRDAWNSHGRTDVTIGRISSGKVGACATDMVGDCRKCGVVICRNCVMKAPPLSLLKLRHRRLCRTCMKAPLEKLITVKRPAVDAGTYDDEVEYRSYARSPCACHEAVWICQPCSQTIRVDDTTYMRGWTWRTRYSTCGGMGAGLGEGNEGVQCGRTRDCLASTLVQKDVECDAAELAALQAETAKAEIQGRHWNGGSYSTQEMVGIGGKIKTKVKKLVPVGAIVKEYEDERVSEKFLGREQSGANRSFCSWCDRVVAGNKDSDEARATKSTDSIASSGSAVSA
ncbi:hypothetical protein TI39_contig48g00009 [Zymoseptoria brevis]|uniref:Uncharacterized protein n=1 Tax=Zymoseptoria brevis TaxID=1047168 RepID=A0A0F4GYN3_9PEZI|nr:hypothetical protein TI39_contig48g00009 [Zymoseptoria brevis]